MIEIVYEIIYSYLILDIFFFIINYFYIFIIWFFFGWFRDKEWVVVL